MLKAMTWAKVGRKMLSLLPIEKESQDIKDLIVDSFVSSVEKEIPKTDLYQHVGCILSEKFCESVNPTPAPELSDTAKSASILLDPIEASSELTARSKRITPEIERMYKARMEERIKHMETIDPIYGLTPSTMRELDDRINSCEITDPDVAIAEKEKADYIQRLNDMTSVPVRSLADQASEMLSSEEEYDEFKNHLSEVLDGIETLEESNRRHNYE